MLVWLGSNKKRLSLLREKKRWRIANNYVYKSSDNPLILTRFLYDFLNILVWLLAPGNPGTTLVRWQLLDRISALINFSFAHKTPVGEMMNILFRVAVFRKFRPIFFFANCYGIQKVSKLLGRQIFHSCLILRLWWYWCPCPLILLGH